MTSQAETSHTETSHTDLAVTTESSAANAHAADLWFHYTGLQTAHSLLYVN